MSKHHPKSALKLKRLKENRLKELEDAKAANK